MDAATSKVDFISSPVLVEVVAARTELLLAVQRGFQNIILESNSLQIVTALHDSSQCLSDVGIKDL